MTHQVAPRARFRPPAALGAAGAALLGASCGSLWGPGAFAQAAFPQAALFEARDLPAERFVLVAAPIGNGERAQLNIYEQIKDTRPCFATSGSAPAQVDPLLGSFDFTGICNRYIDANGYSLRVGGQDLASVYRLSVIRQGGDTVLLAAPTKAGAGPEMVVARSGGQGTGFLQLVLEPGWKLMRRHFGSRALGHLYVYREGWPGAVEATAPSEPVTPGAPAAPATPVAPTAPAAPAAPSTPGAPATTAPVAPAVPASPPAPTLSPSPVPAPAPAPGGSPAPQVLPESPAAKVKDTTAAPPVPEVKPALPAAPAKPATPRSPAPSAVPAATPAPTPAPTLSPSPVLAPAPAPGISPAPQVLPESPAPKVKATTAAPPAPQVKQTFPPAAPTGAP